MMPKVSVIIPYNADRGYLRRAIDSVLGQTYDYVDCIPMYGKDKTTGQNFNTGLQKTDADYVMVCAEDDYLTENAVADLVAGVNGFDFVCANAFIANDFKTVEYRSQVPRNHRVLAEYNSIHGGTVMYRRQMLVDVGGMDETMWTAEEWELNMRLLKLGYKLGYVNAFVQFNNVRAGVSKSVVLDQAKREERKRYINMIRARYL